MRSRLSRPRTNNKDCEITESRISRLPLLCHGQILWTSGPAPPDTSAQPAHIEVQTTAHAPLKTLHRRLPGSHSRRHRWCLRRDYTSAQPPGGWRPLRVPADKVARKHCSRRLNPNGCPALREIIPITERAEPTRPQVGLRTSLQGAKRYCWQTHSLDRRHRHHRLHCKRLHQRTESRRRCICDLRLFGVSSLRPARIQLRTPIMHHMR